MATNCSLTWPMPNVGRREYKVRCHLHGNGVVDGTLLTGGKWWHAVVATDHRGYSARQRRGRRQYSTFSSTLSRRRRRGNKRGRVHLSPHRSVAINSETGERLSLGYDTCGMRPTPISLIWGGVGPTSPTYPIRSLGPGIDLYIGVVAKRSTPIFFFCFV